MLRFGIISFFNQNFRSAAVESQSDFRPIKIHLLGLQATEYSFKKKKIKIAINECFCQSSSAGVVEVSFEIAHMIAKKNKTHNRSC